MIHVKLTRFRTLWACALALCLVQTAHSQQDDQPQVLPTATLTAGIHTIKAMLAQTPQERQVGLMFRREMAANEGMLFVFEAAAPQCFWMKNTLLPLSAAFLDNEGRIINVEDMAPQTLDSHCSKKPARFVLEMHQGWFAKHGLKAGDKLRGPAFGGAGGNPGAAPR